MFKFIIWSYRLGYMILESFKKYTIFTKKILQLYFYLVKQIRIDW